MSTIRYGHLVGRCRTLLDTKSGSGPGSHFAIRRGFALPTRQTAANEERLNPYELRLVLGNHAHVSCGKPLRRS